MDKFRVKKTTITDSNNREFISYYPQYRIWGCLFWWGFWDDYRWDNVVFHTENGAKIYIKKSVSSSKYVPMKEVKVEIIKIN
jgi:hypothetical protein